MRSGDETALVYKRPGDTPARCALIRVPRLHDLIAEVQDMSCAKWVRSGDPQLGRFDTRTGPGFLRLSGGSRQSVRWESTYRSRALDTSDLLEPNFAQDNSSRDLFDGLADCGRALLHSSERLVDRAVGLLTHHAARLIYDRGLLRLFVGHAMSTYPRETNP
jgi:hypothetical protein